MPQPDFFFVSDIDEPRLTYITCTADSYGQYRYAIEILKKHGFICKYTDSRNWRSFIIYDNKEAFATPSDNLDDYHNQFGFLQHVPIHKLDDVLGLLTLRTDA
jgi:hypothetical protein